MTDFKDISIRPVNGGDAEFLYLIMNDPSVLSALHEIPTRLQDWADAIDEWIRDGDEEDYIVEAGSVPAGWLGINGLSGTDKTAYLKTAAFLPEYQGRGIGTYSIREMLYLLKNRGVERVILFTDRANLKAQACYKKCGFRIVETLSETMSDGKSVERYRMESLLKQL